MSDPDTNSPAAPSTDSTPDAVPSDTTPTVDASTTPQRLSGFRQVPGQVWGFFGLVVVISALAGYIVGDHHSSPEATTAAASAPTASADGTDKQESNGTGKTEKDDPGTADGDQSAANKPMTFEEITAQLSPGTGPTTPQADAQGGFDATIFGGRGPVNSREDVLNVHRRNPADPFAIGAVDAPVVISEFSDFECPFCSRFANRTEAELIKKYVDTGYVRLEFNDLPVNGKHAVAAAKAARAAAAQGKFTEFSNALFAASKDISGHPHFELEDYKTFAQQAGVPDMDRFVADATGDKFDQSVTNAQRFATKLGITATPAFVVGGVLVSGAQPTQVFEDAINSELTKVANGTTTPLPPVSN